MLLCITSCFLRGCSLGDLSIRAVIGGAENVKEAASTASENESLPEDFYDDEDILLGEEDIWEAQGYLLSPMKSRADIEMDGYRGYQTIAYFYRYAQNLDTHRISFTYESKLKSGRCKLLIISPSKEIIKTIPCEASGDVNIDIDYDGEYYVRLVGEDAAGEVELNATGLSVIYKFTNHEVKTGLYQYEE